MDDVGIFRTTIGIENLAAPGRIAHLSEALVDTGSEFTWAPRRVVESLGIAPQRRQQFMVADGRLIERDIGFAIIHAGGVTAPDFVVSLPYMSRFGGSAARSCGPQTFAMLDLAPLRGSRGMSATGDVQIPGDSPSSTKAPVASCHLD